MNRSYKKMKISDARNGSIHSGNLMTSNIHDQNDDTVEMPIASPDAFNEVAVNTINPDQEDEIVGVSDEAKEAENLTVISSNANGTGRNLNKQINTNKMNQSLSSLHGFSKNCGYEICPGIAGSSSISGGLTFDKNNKSLKNLIHYIKTAYSNSLTSPKWKNFKGLKLQVIEKIRLNNVIWRTWFEQYKPVASARVLMLEGEYWKRRLVSITNEYKKWREISRKQIKTAEASYPPDPYTANSSNNIFSHFNNLSNTFGSIIHNQNGNNFNTFNNNNNYHNFNNSNSLTAFNNNNINNNVNNSFTGTNYLNTCNNFIPTSFYGGATSANMSTLTTLINTNATTSNNTTFNNNNNNYGCNLNSGSSSSSFNHHFQVASKQMPFNNRCRSPSPGLFNDFDMYNFSSDTLFSTLCFEDQKDPRSGEPDQAISANNQVVDAGNKSNLTNNQTTTSIILPMSQTNTKTGETTQLVSDNMLIRQQQQQQQQHQELNNSSSNAQKQFISLDYSELSNFDTLATVAAAQSTNNLTTVHRNKNKNSDKSLKNNTNTILNDMIIKMPMSQVDQLTNENSFAQYQNNNNANNSSSNGGSSAISSNASGSSNSSGHISRKSNSQSAMNQSTTSGSSATIRNLLALQSPSILQLNNNNVLSVTGGNLSNQVISRQTPSKQQQQQQQPFYSASNLNTFMSSIHKTPSPPSTPSNSALSPPSNTANQLSLNLQQIEKFKQLTTDNQQANSALLSVVLAPNATLAANDLLNNTNDFIQQPPQNKRGRKIITDTKRNSAKRASEPAISVSKMTAKKETASLAQYETAKTLYITGNHSFVNQLTSINDNNNNNNEINSASNSPINSASNFNTNNNSFSIQSIPSLMGQMGAQAQSSDDVNVMKRGLSNVNINSSSSPSISSMLSSSNSAKLPISANNNNANISQSGASLELTSYVSNNASNTPASSSMTRSNSVNSLNTLLDQNLSSAEQKRRCNIQNGFERLQILVPALKDGKNAKVSKAVMLQKASEYIKELQRAREKRLGDLEVYRREIEELSDKISECQNQLPVNGVCVMGTLNKTEKFEQKFKDYVKEKTIENWKFYLFSLILKPLFDNFVCTLNTSSRESMERTFNEWQEKYCNLVQLRPIVSNALRQISRSTSILSDPLKLPEESYTATLTQI